MQLHVSRTRGTYVASAQASEGTRCLRACCLLLIQDWDPRGPDLRPSRPLSHDAPALTPLAVHAGTAGRASIRPRIGANGKSPVTLLGMPRTHARADDCAGWCLVLQHTWGIVLHKG